MELKFLELKQENKSVAEYETKFIELSRFVPAQVDTDEKKALRFQQGLKPSLRNAVAEFELTSYAAVVNKAMIIEGGEVQAQAEREGKKRKFEGAEDSNHGSSQNRFGKRTNFQFRNRGNFGKSGQRPGITGNRPVNVNQNRAVGISRAPLPVCKTCGGKHSGVCNKPNVECFKCHQKGHSSNECRVGRTNGTCFNCGKKGHMAKDCKAAASTSTVPRLPAPAPAPAQAQPAVQPRARTFNMTMRDAVKDANVIAGTLSVNSIAAKVLIDSGATKSFISENFAYKLNCERKPLVDALVIELANQERVAVKQVCP